MAENVGTIDRAIRFVLGVALFVAPLLNVPPVWANPVLAYVVMAVGLVLAATAMFGFCPLYRIVGMSTCKT